MRSSSRLDCVFLPGQSRNFSRSVARGSLERPDMKARQKKRLNMRRR